jgi:ABC-type glycerol-3-phosphate transport system substrate-binding protein
MYSPEYQPTIRALLQEFEKQTHAHANLQPMMWGNAWAEMMKINLYRHGAVVTESGDTWMGTLGSLNGLRKYTEAEVTRMGGARAYPREMWLSCLELDNENVVAIPWTFETYVVYYRTDLFEKAGIDPSWAFSTLDAFTAALERLASNVDIAPFVVPSVFDTFDTLHNAASWVWGMGGEFLDVDAGQTLLSSPNTFAGLCKFFDLHRFMPPSMQQMEGNEAWDLFLDGKVAVTIRESTLHRSLLQNTLGLDVAGRFGLAMVPGIPLVGGSNLLIWKHGTTAQKAAAVKLVEYLTSEQALIPLYENTGMFPARLEVLGKLNSNHTRPIIESFMRGRGFRRHRVWGLVEDKLMPTLNKIWADLFNAPRSDVQLVVSRHMDPLEQQLNITLAQFAKRKK